MPARCRACGIALDSDIDRVHHHHSCKKLRRTESTQRHDMVLNAFLQIASEEARYIVQKYTRE